MGRLGKGIHMETFGTWSRDGKTAKKRKQAKRDDTLCLLCLMVRPVGVEPTTLGLKVLCSAN